MTVRLTPAQSKQLPLFLDSIAVAPFDTAAAPSYAELPFKRRSFDQLIGAHALVLGLTLVTANMVNFADIKGLSVDDWTQPA